MSIANVISFWQRVQADKSLQKRVNPKDGSVPELDEDVEARQLKALAAIAKDEGFKASPVEFAAAEHVMRFWDAVAVDEGLQHKLKAAQKAKSEGAARSAVVKVAKGAGFAFNGKQLQEVTTALEGAGWIGSNMNVQVYVPASFASSYKLAVAGLLSPRIRRGPGLVAEYM